MIYQLVFESNITRIPCYGKKRAGKIIAPGLLSACKQLHHETLAVYYSTTIFLFEPLAMHYWYSVPTLLYDNAVTWRAKEWVRAIGVARATLVSSACFPIALPWTIGGNSDQALREIARIAKRFLDRARQEIMPLSGALQVGVELDDGLYIATNPPTQVANDI